MVYTQKDAEKRQFMEGNTLQSPRRLRDGTAPGLTAASLRRMGTRSVEEVVLTRRLLIDRVHTKHDKLSTAGNYDLWEGADSRRVSVYSGGDSEWSNSGSGNTNNDSSQHSNANSYVLRIRNSSNASASVVPMLMGLSGLQKLPVGAGTLDEAHIAKGMVSERAPVPMRSPRGMALTARERLQVLQNVERSSLSLASRMGRLEAAAKGVLSARGM